MQQQQQQRRRQKPEVKTKKRKKKFPIGGLKTQDGKEIDFGNGHDRKKEEGRGGGLKTHKNDTLTHWLIFFGSVTLRSSRFWGSNFAWRHRYVPIMMASANKRCRFSRKCKKRVFAKAEKKHNLSSPATFSGRQCSRFSRRVAPPKKGDKEEDPSLNPPKN